ncbi:MAG: class I SAM-dependent methyltransferase [Pseudomonadota bacterium]
MAPQSDLDPMLVEHRRIWERKPTLRVIYADYHRRLLEACPPGRILDIGGGSAHIKEHRPDAVSVDILPFPGIDVACDAHRLPFEDGSFSGIVMLDVLHHLERPMDFLHEAARVLRPGGVLAMIEPGMTTVSYPFYRYLHQEPADLSVDPFAPLFSSGPKDPWDSNQAIPTLLFARDDHRAETLKRLKNFSIRTNDWISLFAFPLSGGFKKWCLIPATLTKALIKLEDSLPLAIRRQFAFRLVTVLVRQPGAA